ncbi:DUF732 domain-containing protein [Mycobacterium intracellulare]|uniref:DUF732 domain-containing protein n=1 Tax=Mycobacterium intracellulare TaxID=1767 RepID=UPI002592FBF7|nr:DUF732 domain-containing protein [Mycobacterium intracellulare]MDM3894727.1 DUF732 domain-containing protein [Mycobacterium intracellulare]
MADDDSVSADDTTVHDTMASEFLGSTAWSDVDDLDEPPSGSWLAVWWRAGALVAAGLLIAGLVVLAWTGWPTPAQQLHAPSAAPPSAPASTIPSPNPAPENAATPPAVIPPPSGTAAQRITPPPPLPAPDPDTEFLAAMDRAQVHMTTEAAAINQGHQVCKSLDKGASVQGITARILSLSPGITEPQVRAVVDAAVDAYCPQYESRGNH